MGNKDGIKISICILCKLKEINDAEWISSYLVTNGGKWLMKERTDFKKLSERKMAHSNLCHAVSLR